MSIASRLSKLGSCFSQTINAVILDGHPDESISARAYRMSSASNRWSNYRVFIDKLFYLVEKDHCYKSYRTDMDRAEMLIKNYGGF